MGCPFLGEAPARPCAAIIADVVVGVEGERRYPGVMRGSPRNDTGSLAFPLDTPLKRRHNRRHLRPLSAIFRDSGAVRTDIDVSEADHEQRERTRDFRTRGGAGV